LGYTCRPVEESIKDSIDWFKANSYIWFFLNKYYKSIAYIKPIYYFYFIIEPKT
jgi:hypothetical protein